MGENVIRNTIITVILFGAIMTGFGLVYSDMVSLHYDTMNLDEDTLNEFQNDYFDELGANNPSTTANNTYGGIYQKVLNENDSLSESTFEESSFKTALQGGKESTKSYTSGWFLIKTVGRLLDIPTWVITSFTAILTVLFLFAFMKFIRRGADL